MQKIVPFLWFDTQAEEAANLYVSLFDNSRVGSITRFSEASSQAAGKPAGSVMTVQFWLDGQEIVALNGGPQFKFSEAFSFAVRCKDQAEIDEKWDKLTSDGGEPSYCGWLKDKFGFSWQLTPANLEDLLDGSDPARAERVTAALMEMRKIDLGVLEKAYRGE
ncbi:MAG TPA: VOC family protein [Fimbriimonadaceae bacterium]|nr:VOC family protein [Fimbriimonadaceae bacterium]